MSGRRAQSRGSRSADRVPGCVLAFLKGGTPRPQAPRELFTAVIGTGSAIRGKDVASDGSVLVITGGQVRAPAEEPRIIVNWFSELRRLHVPRESR
jgi:hypothetical protein